MPVQYCKNQFTTKTVEETNFHNRTEDYRPVVVPAVVVLQNCYERELPVVQLLA